MSKDNLIPNYLVSVEWLTSPVEVVGAPVLKTDENGSPKSSAAFPGCLGYSVRLEGVRGVREKLLPNGDSAQVLVPFNFNVTVWTSNGVEGVEEGDYVVIDQPMVGAVNGTLFYQARGLNVVDPLADVLAGDA